MPCETGAAEYQYAMTGFDRVRGGEARLKIQRVLEKVRPRRKHVAVNGAAHPFLLDDEVYVAGMVLPAVDEFLPRGVRVRGARPDRLDLDVKVVVAAIDNEVDLAAVRQQVGLVSDWPGDPLVVEEHLGY